MGHPSGGHDPTPATTTLSADRYLDPVPTPQAQPPGGTSYQSLPFWPHCHPNRSPLHDLLHHIPPIKTKTPATSLLRGVIRGVHNQACPKNRSNTTSPGYPRTGGYPMKTKAPRSRLPRLPAYRGLPEDELGTNSPRGSPALEVGAGQVAVRRLFRGARLLLLLICKYIDSRKKEFGVEPIR